MKKQLITQGAEARIFLVDNSDIQQEKPSTSISSQTEENRAKINDRKTGSAFPKIKKKGTVDTLQTDLHHIPQKFILKSRIPKSYRHPILDQQIRTKRTKSETKILSKAIESGINVPQIIKIDKFEMEIEFIDGDKLSEKLNSLNKEKQFKIMKIFGEQTAKLHDINIIHGDLTTSNTILSNNKVYLIDFGLGFFSSKIEDKAVDLHLIKQALEAKHYKNYAELFENFLIGYNPKEKDKILKKLETVEKRGRYKH